VGRHRDDAAGGPAVSRTRAGVGGLKPSARKALSALARLGGAARGGRVRAEDDYTYGGALSDLRNASALESREYPFNPGEHVWVVTPAGEAAISGGEPADHGPGGGAPEPCCAGVEPMWNAHAGAWFCPVCLGGPE